MRELLGCFFLIFLFPCPGFTQQKLKLEYCDRGDRMEGVGVEETGGAHLDFMGAYIESLDMLPIDSVNSAQLRFYLPESAQVNIIVRDLIEKNYQMIPRQERWLAGWNTFVWPTAPVLRNIPIQLHELIPLLNLAGKNAYAPALLIAEGRQPQKQKYAFVFKTSGQADITITWRKNAGQNFVALESYHLLQPAETPFVVEKEFPAGASSLPDGDYQLQLQGKIKKPTKDEPVDFSCTFYHKSFVETAGQK